MKSINPKNIALGLLGLCTVLSIGGAVSTTLAWYAYASRAALSYSGTSVFDNGQLQIGLKSEIRIDTLVTDEGMIQYPTNDDLEEGYNGPYYYFAPAGEGLSSVCMNAYLSARGYASNELMPVTSGRFDPSDSNHNTHILYKAPNGEVHNPENANNLAPIANYSKMTFAFRAFYTDANGDATYVPNQEIWLTYAQTRASSNSLGNVSQSMRMYINRDQTKYPNNTGFIFNPSAKSAGETKVGGLLNLGYTSYYDFDDNGEILYGDYSIKEGKADDGIINGHYSGDNNIYDINGKWDWESKPNTEENIKYSDTFTAAHSPEAPKYYADLDNVDIKTAKYSGIDTIKPNKDSNGVLTNADTNNPTSVCITGGQNAGYIGEFDATIYLEGWDFSVIDEEQSHMFDFQLRFETNRL